MNINTRYVRTAPNGDQSVIRIENEEQVKYHQDLANQGFLYKEVVIHSMPTGCASCEA